MKHDQIRVQHIRGIECNAHSIYLNLITYWKTGADDPTYYSYSQSCVHICIRDSLHNAARSSKCNFYEVNFLIKNLKINFQTSYRLTKPTSNQKTTTIQKLPKLTNTNFFYFLFLSLPLFHLFRYTSYTGYECRNGDLVMNVNC